MVTPLVPYNKGVHWRGLRVNRLYAMQTTVFEILGQILCTATLHDSKIDLGCSKCEHLLEGTQNQG